MQTRDLVEHIATNLINKQIDAQRDMKVGFYQLLPTRKESARIKRGLRILEAFLKAKGWRMKRDAEGRYKLCEPFSQ
jgi:hypothetical protein